jgi:hypothetical protein
LRWELELLSKINLFKARIRKIDELARAVDDIQKSLGRIEAQLLGIPRPDGQPLHKYEYKVYSQWGEDGIIQHLIGKIEIRNKVFVEFGVQDYRESNTRFLLQNDNWSGLVIDASAEDIAKIRNDSLYYRHDLRAECAFISRDNINDLIRKHGISGDIGLLSIDIDGNDYWIWKAIDVVSPRIVICEYDSLLGSIRAVTTPYDKDFVRATAHYSFLYGGASIVALDDLGRSKGYSLVGSNSAGNNLFFVRNDLVGGLSVLTPAQAYVRARFRNSKDNDGNLTFLSFDESRKVIQDLPVHDVRDNRTISIKELKITNG